MLSQQAVRKIRGITAKLIPCRNLVLYSLTTTVTELLVWSKSLHIYSFRFPSKNCCITDFVRWRNIHNWSLIAGSMKRLVSPNTDSSHLVKRSFTMIGWTQNKTFNTFQVLSKSSKALTVPIKASKVMIVSLEMIKCVLKVSCDQTPKLKMP